MKRILAVLLAVMLFVAVMPVTSLAEVVSNGGEYKVYHVQTSGSILYLHNEPGVNAARISNLTNGLALKKVSSKSVKKDGYTWINIETMNGLEGWVASKYVKDNARVDIDTQRDPLRVRSSRSTKSDKNIIYRIPHGTKGVTIYKVNGNWGYVNYRGNSRKGWAWKSYLRWALW